MRGDNCTVASLALCAASGAGSSTAPARAAACRSSARRVGRSSVRVPCVRQTSNRTVRSRSSNSTSDAAANTKNRTMITLRVACTSEWITRRAT